MRPSGPKRSLHLTQTPRADRATRMAEFGRHAQREHTVSQGEPRNASSGFGRVAVVVPPENPTVEPELMLLVGRALHLHTTRLPVLSGMLRERLEGYNSAMADALASFGALEVSAAFLACTGSSYLLGPDGDDDLCGHLRTLRHAHIASATWAVRGALAALGVGSVVLVSPYPSWLTELAVDFFSACGLRIAGISEVATGHGGIYAISPGEVVDTVEGLSVDEDTAVLFTGTGMRSIEAIEVLASRRVLALSSNLCGAWWMAAQVLGSSGDTALPKTLHIAVRRLADRAHRAGRSRALLARPTLEDGVWDS